MKRLRLITVLLTLLATAVNAGEPRTLVLVCRNDSRLSALTADETRKAFLGAPVVVDGLRVEALRNRSEYLLDEVFLQKVVFLSGPAYDRQVLSRVFRLGGQKPVVYDGVAELLVALRSSPAPVTYMWKDSVRQYPDLRVVATLWTGEVE
jgi:hypothetical protein